MKKHYAKKVADDPEVGKALTQVLDRKGTLLTRPMERLLADPHLLAGWLSLNRKNFRIENGRVVWLRNPLVILDETYKYLNMAYDPEAPAAEVIWSHDDELLQKALRFYGQLREKFNLGKGEFVKLNEIIAQEQPKGGFDAAGWEQIRSAHFGFEAGNELLGVLFMLAQKTNFYDFPGGGESGCHHPRIPDRSRPAGPDEEDPGAAAVHQGG